MSEFVFDLAHPLERCAGETADANAALRDYWAAGSGRALRGLLAKYRAQVASGAVAQPPTRREGTLMHWSGAFRWQDRIAAQERIERAEEERLRLAALEAEAKKWAERRMNVRDRDWAQAERLRLLADQILDEGPKFIKSTKRTIPGVDGAPTREIITVALDGRLMTAAIQAASKLQRLSAEMETDRVRTESASVDVEEMTDDELERILRRAGRSGGGTPETETGEA